MHPRQGRTERQNLGLFRGQLVESLADLIAALKSFGQLDVGRVMPGFTLEQAGVKVGQFRIAAGDVFAEQTKSLATPRLNQRCNQQTIHGTLGFAGTHQGIETSTVGTGSKPSKGDSPAFQQGQDQFKMLQFFGDDRGHLATKLTILRIGVHQVHRGRGRLALTMGVIDQHLVEVLIHLDEPAGSGWRLEMQHGSGSEQGFGKSSRIELGDIFDPFPETHELDRKLKLLADRQDHATFG